MGKRLPGTTVAEKLALNVQRDGDCLRWTGAHTRTGYGQIRVNGKTQSVHRLAYELAHGELSDDLEIDHVAERGCRFRDCIEPTHLDAVSHAENIRRSSEIRHAVCPQGHPREDNSTRSQRGCRRCYNDRQNKRRAKQRAEGALPPRPKRPPRPLIITRIPRNGGSDVA